MAGYRVQVLVIVVFCLTLPLGVVVATDLARRSFERVKLRDQIVSVKGYAERPITSDRAKWSSTVTARKGDLVLAYSDLDRGRTKLLAYLDSRGFKDAAVWSSPVGITPVQVKDKDGNATSRVESYVLRQSFVVTSEDCAAIERLAPGAAELIREGVELEAQAPAFLYTKLDEAKLEMIGEACANARARAESLVKGSTSRLGALRAASQGVFQITPANSTETSGSGMNDTTSVQKTIKAVVTQEYAIE